MIVKTLTIPIANSDGVGLLASWETPIDAAGVHLWLEIGGADGRSTFSYLNLKEAQLLAAFLNHGLSRCSTKTS